MRDYAEVANSLRRCNVTPWPWRVIREALRRSADSIRYERMPASAYSPPVESVCTLCGDKHTDSSGDCGRCMSAEHT